MNPRILEIRKGVLEKNDVLAASLCERFRKAGVLVLNIVSSPGSGKTALLEVTLARLLAQGYRAAALVGDLATDNDAARLARSGASVRQITTSGNCHLEAHMIGDHLRDWALEVEGLDFLFIENVGNLVCPSHYDLGEDIRVVMLSVTEGEDKPLKYPPMFNSSDVAVITKVDLAEAVEFDRDQTVANINSVRPGMTIFETSAKRGAGIDEWIAYIVAQRDALKSPAAP
ncbi:MAG: hydrogenase nickel incorporation protein HypB [Anaerolineae bacterium]|nr:hydrogenase accessory protein HypB [Chloroflexota bacterium]MCO6443053.1 hydrogenase nickel incorporation protein HypB [Anaerolineae bacterium]GIK28212.1 MAG: hydrogenase nickel incorporation protein HypB [Chloroflexota bacterium]